MTLHIYDADDGSVAIEFVTKNYRSGMCLGKKVDESSWWIVGKPSTDEIMMGGAMGIETLTKLRDRLIEIVPLSGSVYAAE